LKPADKKVVGDGPLFIAVRSDAVFFAVGKGGLDAIKEAAAMPTSPAKTMVYYDIKLGPILKLALKKEHEKAAADKAFATDPGQIRVLVEGGQKFEIKIHASISILEFGVMVGTKAKEVQFKSAD
jgi:hypothetical protein